MQVNKTFKKERKKEKKKEKKEKKEERNLTFMDPCIVVWLSRNNQQDATL